MCLLRFEISSKVCQEEAHPPFEHSLSKKGGISDFHAVEANALYLVVKLRPYRFEMAGDVRRAEVHPPFEYSVVEDRELPDFHAVKIGIRLKRAVFERYCPREIGTHENRSAAELAMV